MTGSLMRLNRLRLWGVLLASLAISLQQSAALRYTPDKGNRDFKTRPRLDASSEPDSLRLGSSAPSRRLLQFSQPPSSQFGSFGPPQGFFPGGRQPTNPPFGDPTQQAVAGVQFDPITGQPYVIDPNTGQQFVVDPNTGQRFPADPNTGQQFSVDPTTGQRLFVDPNTGQRFFVDPNTGQRFVVDPNTGQRFPVDPNTGRPLNLAPPPFQFDSVTGQYFVIDRTTGQRIFVDPQTGRPIPPPQSIPQNDGFFEPPRNDNGVNFPSPFPPPVQPNGIQNVRDGAVLRFDSLTGETFVVDPSTGRQVFIGFGSDEASIRIHLPLGLTYVVDPVTQNIIPLQVQCSCEILYS